MWKEAELCTWYGYVSTIRGYLYYDRKNVARNIPKNCNHRRQLMCMRLRNFFIIFYRDYKRTSCAKQTPCLVSQIRSHRGVPWRGWWFLNFLELGKKNIHYWKTLNSTLTRKSTKEREINKFSFQVVGCAKIFTMILTKKKIFFYWEINNKY